MEFMTSSREDMSLWLINFLTILEISKFTTWDFLCIIMVLSTIALTYLAITSPGGPAWKNGRSRMGRVTIPGPRSLPFFGSLLSLSHGLPHKTLASMANNEAATQLMAFSLGSNPAIITSDPQIAREILISPHFANRPVKQSAKLLMFSRAIGFAPNGAYWRLLRRIASSHLFAPKRILAHEPSRQLECASMLSAIAKEQTLHGFVILRKHLQAASLNNIMEIVFGKKYDLAGNIHETKELHDIVREGFELLGAFNWSDHLPWLNYFYDPFHINDRCLALVCRVQTLVKQIIEEHKQRKHAKLSETSDFVDVLLSLEGEEKLQEDDMLAILWEMIFRGTDTTALLTEWIMAELILNAEVQAKLRQELDTVVGERGVVDSDISNLPFLRAVVKETLRVHPPGPLLSWSRLSTSDVHLSNGMVIPSNTTAMVNMWAITHDPNVWEDPLVFNPERFLECDVDVRGCDLRLAPFGAGRRVCPGKNLGMVTVSVWVAKLVQHFEWVQEVAHPVELDEVLKLSSEMKKPLFAITRPVLQKE